MEKDFEIIEHTADVGIKAYGTDISHAFANTAKALFSLITELDNVAEVLHRDTEVTASDHEGLLVEWLNELIYLFDTEHILFRRFEITKLNHNQLKARNYGEKVNKTKHKLKTGIKAATYHILKVDRNDGCQIQVLFDI